MAFQSSDWLMRNLLVVKRRNQFKRIPMICKYYYMLYEMHEKMYYANFLYLYMCTIHSDNCKIKIYIRRNK